MQRIAVIILTLCAGIAQATPITTSGSSDGWSPEFSFGELLYYHDGGNQIISEYGPSSIVVYGSGFGFMMNGTLASINREQWYLDTDSRDRIEGLFSGLVSPGFSVGLGLPSAMHQITGMFALSNAYSVTGEYTNLWEMTYDTNDALVSHAPEPGSVALVASGLLFALIRTRNKV